MEITDVRVKLCNDSGDQLKAFCSITLDGNFVVRDLKVIEGTTGLFVAMPSRKLTDRCPKCRHKNHLRARFCNDCGAKLRENRMARNNGGRNKMYVDVAHPINSECRKLIQDRVVEAYQEEAERAQQPGYVPQDYDEEELQEAAEFDEAVETEEPEPQETSEYEDLIRELKNEASARRYGSGGAPREDRRGDREEEAAPPPRPRPKARPPEPAPRPQPAPRPAPPPRQAPPPRPKPAPVPVARPEPPAEDDSGFGAGIL